LTEKDFRLPEQRYDLLRGESFPGHIHLPRSSRILSQGLDPCEGGRSICERSNYRFWFGYDGAPYFQPAAVLGEPAFSFTSPGHLKDSGVYQDLKEVRNRIVIEGIEQAMYAMREEKQSSRLSGEASDETSIDAYLEKSYDIKNHLFQDQG
jgi:hypothetical protein